MGANKNINTVDYFRTRKEALLWLRSKGYQISQGKFYQDCAAGFPPVNADKTVSKWQVAEYAASLNAATTPSKPQSTIEDEQRKARADADIAEIKAERMRREHDAAWLHAADAWGIMAGLVGTLRDSIRHHVYTAQSELVQIVGGDQVRSQEGFEYIDAVIDKAFNEVAAAAMKIEFEKTDETTPL